MSSGESPARLAQLDQATAGIDDELDILLVVASQLVADNGAMRGGADLTAFLNYQFGPVELAAICARAIVRLATGGAR